MQMGLFILIIGRHVMQRSLFWSLGNLKVKFSQPKAKSLNGVLVVPLIDSFLLDEQEFFFVITMKINFHVALHSIIDCNPTIMLSTNLASNVIITLKPFEYLKLVGIAIVMVLGSEEDKQTFITMNFMKSELCNCLTKHLNLVVKMHAHQFYEFHIIPFYSLFMSGARIIFVMEMCRWQENL